METPILELPNRDDAEVTIPVKVFEVVIPILVFGFIMTYVIGKANGRKAAA